MLNMKQKLERMMRKLMINRIVAFKISINSMWLLIRYSASDSISGWWQLPFWTQVGGRARSDVPGIAAEASL